MFAAVPVIGQQFKKRTATKNKLHGEETLGIPSKFVYRSLKRNLKHLDKEIVGIDERLLSLVKKEQQQQLTLLTTVPGIGTKTALFLIVLTDGFQSLRPLRNFAVMLVSTPVIRESGSSVRGLAISE